MYPIDFSDIVVSGDLLERAHRNFNRLEQDRWRPENLFQPPNYGWPGDMEGRTVLALTLLAQATRRDPRFLSKILEKLPEHVNPHGYFGRVLNGECDEQQLSSHGWVLRGLCEHYLWTHDNASLEAVSRIVDRLVLPSRGFYSAYPARPEQRSYDAGHMGELAGKHGSWHSSTDIGCAFILLDGAVQAYTLLGDPRLDALIVEMIDAFLRLDFEGLSCQTHATLTGLRGLLRYYAIRPEARLIEETQRIWALYTSKAMTEHYGNHNWFGRPTMTEGCAVVDSLMVGVDLWRLTGKPEYLDTAHHIAYNALRHAQRSNGGFGCDTCVGAGQNTLACDPEIYESWWCCTMRGGEGLARAIQYGYFLDPQGVTLPFYENSEARLRFLDGEVQVSQRSLYPFQGDVDLDILSSSVGAPKTFRFFLPEWARGTAASLEATPPAEVRVAGPYLEACLAPRAGTRLKLRFPTPLRACPALDESGSQRRHTFRHGPLVLGAQINGAVPQVPANARLASAGDGRYHAEGQDILLEPTSSPAVPLAAGEQPPPRHILFED